MVVCITGVTVILADAADDDLAQARHEHRQRMTDCSAVNLFAKQTMQYTNVLPATKSHGMLSSEFPCRDTNDE